MLVCDGLARRYGETLAVRDVSFRIDPGETYGLLGPNGAGKTTTISMVCGLLEPDAGSITVAGVPMTPTAVRAKAHVGLVPQDVAIYPDLTGRENLEFFGRLSGLQGARLGERVDAVLETVGLADRARDRAEAYSGGMKRRLNIAVGLLHEPDLLVLDEPTVGVDPQSRNAILESVEALGGAGMAVLYTTHYMEEAERLCDRIGIIDEGVLQAEGTQRELVAQVGQQDRVVLAAVGDLTAAEAAVVVLPGVRGASAGDGRLACNVDDARRRLPDILRAAGDAGAAVTSVEVVEPDLEAVFLHLTGKALRDQ